MLAAMSMGPAHTYLVCSSDIIPSQRCSGFGQRKKMYHILKGLEMFQSSMIGRGRVVGIKMIFTSGLYVGRIHLSFGPLYINADYCGSNMRNRYTHRVYLYMK